jgi:hypothetical protein
MENANFDLQRRAGFLTRQILILKADWKVRPPLFSIQEEYEKP